jgi:acyl-coenzyme A synthetase/AMP-(fatty) acid ligase
MVPTHFNFARDVVERWARERPNGLALWCVGEDGSEHKFSFGQLANAGRRAAHFFQTLGLRRGDRVLVILPRVPQWWVAMLGLVRLGAVPIPGTPMLTSPDLRYRIETAEVSAIITDGDGAGKVEDACSRRSEKEDSLAGRTGPPRCRGGYDPSGDFRGVRLLIGTERAGWANFDEGVRGASAAFEPELTRSDDPGILYFTSGTTGPPKMVLHTQASYGLAHRLTGELWLDLKPDDVHWNLSDTGWGKAAWSSFFGPWHMGACVFSVDTRGKFNAVAALRTLASYPITTWCAPPTALRLMVRENLSAYRFSKLRHCVSAGEPVNPEVISGWKAATGLTIYEGYGQTETVILIANFRSPGREVRAGSMGQPARGFELALLDRELNELPADREGEIAIRVKPNRPLGLFREYWRNPQENAARFRGDWYLTGDTARRDADGYYWFVGRADDVIKSAGYRIGPFEVESALIEHPAVVEAAVVGKTDAVRGQIVKAFVVLRKGHAASDSLKAELQEHCKRVTAPYKYPREIQFVSELPKTTSGKIRRIDLRERG